MRIQPTKYTGPAKRMRLHRTYTIHPIDNRVSRALFLLALIAVLVLDLFVWRPN